ncbi:MAG TPA: amidohydrolase family protein [Bryobacteraceae bacterium]|nr:amidohydrolase family protein [Bryobacteraceae bacterium]
MSSSERSVLSRRELLGGIAASLPLLGAGRPKGPIVDSHVHLFSPDLNRFPLAPNATYKPTPLPVEEYVRFATSVGIDHAVIVHPEPYQDDYRYLEYCFAHEPSPMFFKGTCLFDPTARDTPDRISTLVGMNPGRIVALRIHETHKPGTPSFTSGPIKDRDMRSPAMKATWRRVSQLGLAIQMHFLPYYSPQIGELAAQFPDTPVILDHLGRAGEGTAADFAGLLKLAKLPQVYMKYSGANYSSKEKYPYADVKPMVRRIYDAFGPNRMIWGYFGHDRAGFDKEVELLDLMFDFASEEDKEKIRGRNALKLFKWTKS